MKEKIEVSENQKMSLGELVGKFREYNKLHNVSYSTGEPTLEAVIVYRQSNFAKPYTELERSYKVTNTSGKMFFDDMWGHSIYADCLDGTDNDVRLDWVDWTPDYCYMLSDMPGEIDNANSD